MEIEIVTTKKKLTKSIIEQMREVNIEEIENANVLGFVMLNPIVILLELDRFEYRKMYWHWNRRGTTHLYRTIKGRYTVDKPFKTEEERDLYFAKLNELKDDAVQIYI